MPATPKPIAKSPPRGKAKGESGSKGHDQGNAEAAEPEKTPEAEAADPTERAGEWANERLSATEADALASAIRPSWQVDSGGWSSVDSPPAEVEAPTAADVQAAPEPPAVDLPSIVIDDAAFGPVIPVASSLDEEDPLLPVSRSPAKMLGLLAAVAGIAILAVAASMMGGEPTTAEPVAQASSAAGAPSTQSAEPAPPGAQAAEPSAPDTQSAEPSEPTAEPEPVAAAEPEPVAAAEPEPVAEPAPPPQVHVTLRAAPSAAQLTLDGAPIPNPYQADVPLDHRQHRLVASLDGYRETTRSLGFDRDQSETLALAAVPAPPPATMASSMSHHVAAGTHRSSSMRASSMRTNGMRTSGMRAGRHSAGFTSANPY